MIALPIPLEAHGATAWRKRVAPVVVIAARGVGVLAVMALVTVIAGIVHLNRALREENCALRVEMVYRAIPTMRPRPGQVRPPCEALAVMRVAGVAHE